MIFLVIRDILEHTVGLLGSLFRRPPDSRSQTGQMTTTPANLKVLRLLLSLRY